MLAACEHCVVYGRFASAAWYLPSSAVCVSAVQRAPDKRAPAIVSLVFTGLTVAPLGLLVMYLGTLGVNFKVRGGLMKTP